MRGDGDAFVMTMHPETREIPLARAFVRLAVEDLAHPADHIARDAELLTSEAVSNAVLHAGTEITIVVQRIDESSFMVAVHDAARDPIPEPRDLASNMSPDGRGLAIIDAFAEAWGVERLDDDGKIVWFIVGPDSP